MYMCRVLTVINCVFLLHYCNARTFSLNEYLATESSGDSLFVSESPLTTSATPYLNKKPKITKSAAKTITSSESPVVGALLKKKLLHFTKTNRNKIAKDFLKKIQKKRRITAPQKLSKLLHLNLPLKAKKLLGLKKKRRNKSVKRHTDNEVFNGKYIPILRDLAMLFDNLLDSDDGEYEEDQRFELPDKDITCVCSRKSKQEEKTTTDTPVPAKISYKESRLVNTVAKKADNTSIGDVSGVGSNQNISILPARNTAGRWRNNNGFSKRSRSPFHSSFQRNIPRDNGAGKYYTRRKRYKTSSKYNEKNTTSTPRVSTSSYGPHNGGYRGRRNNTETQEKTAKIDEIEESTTEFNRDRGIDEKLGDETSTVSNVGGSFTEFEVSATTIGGEIEPTQIENKQQVGRDEGLYPDLLRGGWGFVPDHKISDDGGKVQSRENYEKSVFDVSQYLAGNQQLSQGNGSNTTENKKHDTSNEAIVNSYKNSKNIIIYDGYSVTRGKLRDSITGRTIPVH